MSMSKFKPANNRPTERSAKDLSLGFVKSILIQMAEKGKSDEQLLAFIKDPSPISLGLTDIDATRDWFYHQIRLNTTSEERFHILVELDQKGLIPKK